MEQKNLRIAFCIVCMNRLHQLKQTLLQNIVDSADYDNLEFVILNYNSKDGMEEWVRENLSAHIDSGRIVYYQTPEPEVFIHSHSKNMAFKLANSDIVCNINADHFTGPGFPAYINEQFTNDEKIVLTTIDYFKTNPDYKPATDVMGKVCVKKSDFEKITGFDENMTNYGYEDYDFVNRLEMSGLKRVFINNPAFLKFIGHTSAERYTTDTLVDKIDDIYVNYITPSQSEVLILYKNNQYQSGMLMDNSLIDTDDPVYAYKERKVQDIFSRKERNWNEGEWEEDYQYITLTNSQLAKQKEAGYNTLVKNHNDLYYQITDADTIKNLSDFVYIYCNRALSEQNLAEKRMIVNNKFGEGLVYKNFDQVRFTK